MSVSIGAMSAAKVLRNQGGIWSGPQALLGFNEDSCVYSVVKCRMMQSWS